MINLKNLYKNNEGKVSDKWSSYIEKYDEKFLKYKDLPINLLEIGVQNGGSLEIYSKYFSKAKNIIGCDVNPKCENLKFDDQKIKIVVGNANHESIKNQIIKFSEFDIIIEDGSHTSLDIVSSFCKYFNYLKDGGLYIIEDIHCSYWENWGGGLFYPISSINFFKKLVDIINYEHWGIDKKKLWLLKNFSTNFKININELDLESLNSIEFSNSLCFIQKNNPENNKLGTRIISGKSTEVLDEVHDFKKMNNVSKKIDQSKNPWSNTDLLPEDELFLVKITFEILPLLTVTLTSLTHSSIQ